MWDHVKKTWGIRHIRFAYKAIRFSIWWNRFGRHFYMFPNQADLNHLQSIKEGKA